MTNRRKPKEDATINDNNGKTLTGENINMSVCFIDFEKAFDTVDWKKLMEILRNLGIDWKDRRLIRNLYHFQEVSMRTNIQESETASWEVYGKGASYHPYSTLLDIHRGAHDRSTGRH